GELLFRSHGGRGPLPSAPRRPARLHKAAALEPRAGGVAFLVNGCEQPLLCSLSRRRLLRLIKPSQTSARDQSRRPRPALCGARRARARSAVFAADAPKYIHLTKPISV